MGGHFESSADSLHEDQQDDQRMPGDEEEELHTPRGNQGDSIIPMDARGRPLRSRPSIEHERFEASGGTAGPNGEDSAAVIPLQISENFLWDGSATDMVDFAMRPAPPTKKLYCHIQRVNANGGMFRLYVEDRTTNTRRLCMTSRRLGKGQSANYIISFEREANLDNAIARVRSNFLGLKFKCYDLTTVGVRKAVSLTDLGKFAKAASSPMASPRSKRMAAKASPRGQQAPDLSALSLGGSTSDLCDDQSQQQKTRRDQASTSNSVLQGRTAASPSRLNPNAPPLGKDEAQSPGNISPREEHEEHASANFHWTDHTSDYMGAFDDDEDLETDLTKYPEIANVTYESNILGMRGPRKMNVVIPGFTVDGERLQWRTGRSVPSLMDACKDPKMREKTISVENKMPHWNDDIQSYTLDFRGRVTMASVKNFQLCYPKDPDYVILQMGKVSADIFTLDYSFPLSAQQAFCIALTSFHNKLACE
eukprot:Clim_evm57s214 gene=Clim_evmTU57s214